MAGRTKMVPTMCQESTSGRLTTAARSRQESTDPTWGKHPRRPSTLATSRAQAPLAPRPMINISNTSIPAACSPTSALDLRRPPGSIARHSRWAASSAGSERSPASRSRDDPLRSRRPRRPSSSPVRGASALKRTGSALKGLFRTKQDHYGGRGPCMLA